MSDIITGAAIPDDVMAEAVEAAAKVYAETEGVDCGSDGNGIPYGYMILGRDSLTAALPILTSAIERNLLTRIADDAHARGMEYFARNGMDVGAEEMFIREEWIRSFLPTEDEEEK